MNNTTIFNLQELLAHQTAVINALLQDKLEAENPSVGCNTVDGCAQQQKVESYNAVGIDTPTPYTEEQVRNSIQKLANEIAELRQQISTMEDELVKRGATINDLNDKLRRVQNAIQMYNAFGTTPIGEIISKIVL